MATVLHLPRVVDEAVDYKGCQLFYIEPQSIPIALLTAVAVGNAGLVELCLQLASQ